MKALNKKVLILIITNSITLVLLFLVIYIKLKEDNRNFSITPNDYMRAELENGNTYEHLYEEAMCDAEEKAYNRLASLIMNSYGSEFALFHALTFFNRTGNLTALSDIAGIYSFRYTTNKKDPSFYFTLFFLTKAYEMNIDNNYYEKKIRNLIGENQAIQPSGYYMGKYVQEMDSLTKGKRTEE
jgi:hypothetical protein